MNLFLEQAQNMSPPCTVLDCSKIVRVLKVSVPDTKGLLKGAMVEETAYKAIKEEEDRGNGRLVGSDWHGLHSTEEDS